MCHRYLWRVSGLDVGRLGEPATHVVWHLPRAHLSTYREHGAMRVAKASLVLLAAFLAMWGPGTAAMGLGKGWKRPSEMTLVGGYNELEDVRVRKDWTGPKRRTPADEVHAFVRLGSWNTARTWTDRTSVDGNV